MKINLIFEEGFFSSDEEENKKYPKVMDQDYKWYGRKKFIEALLEVENRAKTTHYRGQSTCRVCRCHNGSSEYKITHIGVTFKWPEGFMHYVKAHNVRPSYAFQQFILSASAE